MNKGLNETLFKKETYERNRLNKMNNHGQFFLLAAVIIITGIVAIASIKTFVIEPGGSSQERVYDLSEELGFESAKVIDYGVYNNAYTDSLMDSWLDSYTDYAKNKEGIEEWLFVYGDEEELRIISYTSEETGGVSMNLGNDRIGSRAKSELKKEKKKLTNNEKRVIIKDTLGIDRDFNLERGENFYFVLAKINEGETIINKK